jgi:hypothetical protein
MTALPNESAMTRYMYAMYIKGAATMHRRLGNTGYMGSRKRAELACYAMEILHDEAREEEQQWNAINTTKR